MATVQDLILQQNPQAQQIIAQYRDALSKMTTDQLANEYMTGNLMNGLAQSLRIQGGSDASIQKNSALISNVVSAMSQARSPIIMANPVTADLANRLAIQSANEGGLSGFLNRNGTALAGLAAGALLAPTAMSMLGGTGAAGGAAAGTAGAGGLTALPAGGMTATGALGGAGGMGGLTGAAIDAGLAGSAGITNMALGAGGAAGGLGGAASAGLAGLGSLGSNALNSLGSNALSGVMGGGSNAAATIPTATNTTNSLSSFLNNPSLSGAGQLLYDNAGNLINAGLGAYSSYQAGQAAKDVAAQNAAMYAPWLAAGTNALGQITAGLQPGGEFRKTYTVADYQQDPYNKFLQDQGNQAITRSAAAKGTLNSGNVLADLSKYNQNVSGQGFQDQWTRNQADTSNQYNRLASTAGLGQTAAQNTMSGNAFGTMGSANANTGMINSLSNLFNSNPVNNFKAA